MRISVKEVADVMQVSQQFVRRGLQLGKFNWGYAIKIQEDGKYTYWISQQKFEEETGLSLDNKEKQ